MNAIKAIETCANSANIPITKLSTEYGRKANYINVMRYKGTTPNANTLSELLELCGYKLCAIPNDAIPNDAIVIDASETD